MRSVPRPRALLCSGERASNAAFKRGGIRPPGGRHAPPRGKPHRPSGDHGVWLSVEADGAMLKRLFERFTEDARQVIVAARQESLSLTALESRHRLKAQPGATSRARK